MSEATDEQGMHQRQKPSIYEVAKRYAACTYALADILGIDPLSMLKNHREVITAVFMQASREGIRIRPEVKIPPLPRLISEATTMRRVS
jgi:hypothetical protein